MKRSIGISLALFLCASPLFAAQIFEDTTFTGQGTFETTLSFDGFNPSLGTLNEVAISIKDGSAISGASIGYNSGESAATISANFTGDVDVSATSHGSALASVDLFAMGSILNLPANSSGPIDATGIFLGSTYFDFTGLSIYENPFTLYVDGSSSCSSNNDGCIDPTVSLAGGIEVDYYFTPAPTASATPEPPALALLGTGLLGAAALAARRRNLPA